MTIYGSKVYGSFVYTSASATTDISVYPFTANALNYGSINLSWVYPLSSGNFSTFLIVRNPMGFPVTADNGDVIFKSDKTTLNSSSLLGATGSLTDNGSFYDVLTGQFTASYTATVFSAVTNSTKIVLAAPNSNIKKGQLVSGVAGVVGGTTVSSIVTDSSNVTTLTLDTPATVDASSSLTFSGSPLTAGKTYYYSVFVLSNGTWQRVGTAMASAIKNYNTADTLYNSLPLIYRAALTSSAFLSDNKNTDLYNLLRTVAVEYDRIKTRVENATNRYDVKNLNGKLVPALMDEMGFVYESGLGLQQGRRLLNYADYIYLNKGTAQGIRQFASSFSGYSASLGTFKNLFLTLDCSSFEYQQGFWNGIGLTASVGQTAYGISGATATPYLESTSPSNYPNAQAGYLKVTTLTASPSSTTDFSYGISLDAVSVSTSTANSATPGYQYITLTTDTEHNFSVGQQVVIQGMTPKEINGIFKVLTVTNSRVFTVYNAAITTSQSIAPLGFAGLINIYDPKLYGIPVTEATAYSFSIYSWAKTVLRSVTLGIKWYDKYGNYISSSSTTSANNAVGSWARLNVVNQTSPATTAYAVPYGYISSAAQNEIHYFDAAQFEKSSTATSYVDARRVDLFLSAPRINQIVNAGFEADTSNWTTTGTAPTTGFVIDSSNVYPTSSVGLGTAISTKSAKLTSNATTTTLAPSATIAVTPKSPYAFSAYVKGSNADAVTVTVVWKNAGGTTLQTDVSSSLTLSTTTFSRLSLSPVDRATSATQMIAPATAATATITLTFTGASSHIYYVDSVLFESSATVNTYFDGSTGYYNLDDTWWEQNASGTAGTPSTGRSLYYPNRAIVQSRLNTVLPDYLPIGTNYAIFIGTTAT